MSKKLFLTLFVLSSSLLAFSQGSWSPRTSLPDSARGYGIGFSIGNYGYVGLGYSSKGSNNYYYHDFWQFNPATNLWTRKADFPGLARICPATFVIGNKAYVVTGQDTATKCGQECWQYDPSTNIWTQKANYPGAARAYDVGFAIGRKGYVGLGSGYYVDFRNDFWAYDTLTSTWSQIANFPAIARFVSNGFAVNGKGYVCFGADSLYTFYNEIWEYDTTNSWTKKTNCPGDSMYGTAGFVIGNSIYVGTGGNNSGFFNEFWKYTPLLDSWTLETSPPGPPKAICSTFSVGDTGYMGLGLDSTTLYLNSMYRFLSDSTIGISELHNYGNQIIIYPNPFSRFCTVSVPQNSNIALISFTLDDMEGRKVQFNIEKLTSTNYIIHTGLLERGIYTLSINFNNQIIHKKLIINK